MADAGTDGVLRSPRQASVTFSLDGKAAPRLKNLFYVRFVRGSSATSQSGWDKDLGFLVKSVERPAITPITEELHQYNKKRQVHTGYKANPVRISIYDTADSLCGQMWSEYSKHYFGDFGHKVDTTDYGYDVTTNSFKDSDGTGYGFNPSGTTTMSSSTGASDNNSQFFFDRIQIFQVWNKQYIQYDLINPKITSYDPDDFSYEDSSAAVINLTVAYEAIITANNGAPQALSASSALKEAFADKRLDGDVYDIAAVDTTVSANTYAPQVAANIITNILNPVAQTTLLRSYATSDATGALSSFGNFNFGTVGSSRSASSGFRPLATDLSLQALTNPALAAALNITTPGTLAASSGPSSTGNAITNRSIDPATYDVARSAIAAISHGASDMEAAYIIDEMVRAVLAAGATGTGPRDQLRYAQPSATDNRSDITSDGKRAGVALSDEAYGILNAQRSPTAQLCSNKSINLGGAT